MPVRYICKDHHLNLCIICKLNWHSECEWVTYVEKSDYDTLVAYAKSIVDTFKRLLKHCKGINSDDKSIIKEQIENFDDILDIDDSDHKWLDHLDDIEEFVLESKGLPLSLDTMKYMMELSIQQTLSDRMNSSFSRESSIGD